MSLYSTKYLIPMTPTTSFFAGFWITLILKGAAAYTPEEIECPDKIHPGIEALEFQVPMGTPYRAWRSLPWRYFTIQPSQLTDAGMGVYAATFIPKNTWLGQYEGEIIQAPPEYEDEDEDDEEGLDLTYAWEVYKDDNATHYIDGMDPKLSNWLRFLNSPSHVTEQNVDSHVCYGRIYYRMMKNVHPGTELLVYYGDDYAEYLDIDVDNFFNLNKNDYGCFGNNKTCK